MNKVSRFFGSAALVTGLTIGGSALTAGAAFAGDDARDRGSYSNSNDHRGHDHNRNDHRGHDHDRKNHDRNGWHNHDGNGWHKHDGNSKHKEYRDRNGNYHCYVVRY